MTALAAGSAFTALLGATAAVYAAVDVLGALVIAGFLLLSLGVAASGWVLNWREEPPPEPVPAPLPEPSHAMPRLGDPAALRLLDAVAGELKNAAGTIRGFSEILEAVPDVSRADEEAREICSHILANSRHLTAFAAQLHDYVRCERGRLRLSEQQVDAAELVEAALSLCRERAEASDVTIVATLPEGVEVSCDAERIRQAIASLVVWAASCSAAGGILDVALSRAADGGLVIDIHNEADPLPEACGRTRLFEPQLSQTGLDAFALPIASRVALLHSGEVMAECARGQGTAARLTLPVARVLWPEQQDAAACAA